jgi:hypothetical protein
MLDLVDEPLDQVALLVEVLVVRDGSRAGAVRWNNSLSARVCNRGSKAIGVVALIGEQIIEGKTADQAFCLTDIGDLACRQDEANRIAESVDGNADLRAQPAARMPDRLIFASPFWAPAACWCARTMVESMIRYSRSGFSPNSVKSRCQTPFFAHRRKRLNTLFQLPNSSGKSSPARIHNRMPVFLQPKDFAGWLDGSARPELLKPASEELLQAWPVSKRVNRPSNDEDASLVEPIELAGL